MGSRKAEKASKTSLDKNPKRRLPLGPNKPKIKKINKNKSKNKENLNNSTRSNNAEPKATSVGSPSQQLHFFLDQFQSSNGIQLSSIELESFNDSCILELSQGFPQDATTLGKHLKAAFESSWKEVLCEGQLLEGKVDPGNPAVLIISTSALRSLEFIRGVRSLTRECHAAKLFSKHMKVEDQVTVLQNRVNIASGTPSRIKKLIDMEALGLSRLAVIVLDMHTDVKGYSLFTLPQVRNEFWDLHKSYFHQRLIQGDVRICLYGHLQVEPRVTDTKKKRLNITSNE